MEDIVPWLQLTVATTATASLVALLFEAKKQILHLVWGVFCGSLAVMMIKQLAGDAIGPYQHLVGLGACATCNAYWLVARALCRPEAPFTRWHLGLAGAIALLMMAREGLRFADAQGLVGPALSSGVDGGLKESLALLGPGVLVLTLREGLAGWQAAAPGERRLRAVFLATFVAALLASMVAPGLVEAWGLDPGVESALQASAALLVLVVTTVLVQLRSRAGGAVEEQTPAPAVQRCTTAEPARFPEEELELARAIEHRVREAALYLQPELKVADLARALGVPGYRVSRAVTGPLGQRNFNRYINRYRIEHARSLLADATKAHWPVVVVAMESGFASAGPFNRAFKETVGMTPSAYRSDCRGDGGELAGGARLSIDGQRP